MVTKLATQAPEPQVLNSAVWIADNAVSTGPFSVPCTETLTQGEGAFLISKFNDHAVRIDVGCQLGSGCIGVALGLEVSEGSGLNPEVSAGQALIGGVVELRTASTLTVGASATTWVWLKQNGTFELRTDLLAPATAAVLLGGVVTDGTEVVSVETGGVVRIINGIPERETADVSMPLDTPEAGWRGWTKTLGGLFWWNGETYQGLGLAGRLAIALADTDATLTASQVSRRILEFSGTLTATRTLTLPLQDAAEFIIYNATGQTLTLKAVTGTGVNIATGKRASIYCDGTNYVRLTPDT